MRSIVMTVALAAVLAAAGLGAQTNPGGSEVVQPAAAAAPAPPDLLAVAKRLMTEAHYAFLVTVGAAAEQVLPNRCQPLRNSHPVSTLRFG